MTTSLEDRIETAKAEHRSRWRDPDRHGFPDWQCAAEHAAPEEKPQFFKSLLFCDAWERFLANEKPVNWESLLRAANPLANNDQIKLVRAMVMRDCIRYSCHQLEDAWKEWNEGKPEPYLREFLPDEFEPRYGAWLEHLIACDYRFRQEITDDTVDVAQYETWFPDHVNEIERAVCPVVQGSTRVAFTTDVMFVEERLKSICQPKGSPWKIGHFTIIGDEPIGTGGFAKVYRAFDERKHCEVALKIPELKFKLNRDANVRTFCLLSEVRSMARFRNSPGILTVYNVTGPLIDESMSDEEIAWLLRDHLTESSTPPMIEMTLAELGTLRRLLKDSGGRFTPSRSVQVLISVAESLAEIHKEQVVHRDLKPENILFDRKDQPLIADMGIAISIEDTSEVRGRAIGTLHYMAPEVLDRSQREQLPQELQSARDIYSLGVILFEMMTGRRPFQEPRKAELIHQIIHADPPNPGDIVEDVDAELSAICLSCLEKSPSARPDAELLARRLEQWQEHQTTPAYVKRFVVDDHDHELLGSKRQFHEANVASLKEWLNTEAGPNQLSVFWIDADEASSEQKELIGAMKQSMAVANSAGNEVWEIASVDRLPQVVDLVLQRPPAASFVVSFFGAFPRGDGGASHRAWKKAAELLMNPQRSLPRLICVGSTDEIDRLKSQEFGDRITFTHVRFRGPDSAPTGRDEWICVGELEEKLCSQLDVPGGEPLSLEDHYQPLRVKRRRYNNYSQTAETAFVDDDTEAEFAGPNSGAMLGLPDLSPNRLSQSAEPGADSSTDDPDEDANIEPVADAVTSSSDARKLVELREGSPKRVAVFGPPGSGKSTLLKDLVMCCWRTTRRGEARIAVRVDLGDFEKRKLRLPEYLAQRYEAIEEKKYRPTAEQVRQKLKNGNVTLLLDGLDEVRGPQFVREWLEEYVDCRFVMTSRIVVPSRDHRRILSMFDQHFELTGLSEEQCRQYILDYTATAPRYDGHELIDLLESSLTFREFTENPLLLSVFCLSADEARSGVVPQTRASLYRMAVTALLSKNHADVAVEDINRWLTYKQRALESLALDAYLRHEGIVSRFSRVHLQQAFSRHVPEGKSVWADQLFNEVLTSSRMLRRLPGDREYAFCHPAFQEFFAASALIYLCESEGDGRRFDSNIEMAGQQITLSKLLDYMAWMPQGHGILLFLVGLSKYADRVIKLIRNPVATANVGGDDIFSHRLSLAATSLTELDEQTRWKLGELVDAITEEVWRAWQAAHESGQLSLAKHLTDALLAVTRCNGCIDGVPIVQYLASQLAGGGNHPAYRDALVATGTQVGNPQLIRQLFHLHRMADPFVRSQLLPVLRAMCQDSDFATAMKIFLEVLRENNASLLKHAETLLINAASRQSTPEVINGLTELLEMPSVLAQIAAARAIGQLRVSERRIPEQLQLLGILIVAGSDADPRVQVAMIDGITESGSRSQSVGLVSHLVDVIADARVDETVANSAMHAIQRLTKDAPSSVVIDTLPGMLTSSNQTLPRRAVKLIRLLGPRIAKSQAAGDLVISLMALLSVQSSGLEDAIVESLEQLLPHPLEHSELMVSILRLTTASPSAGKRVATFFIAAANHSFRPDQSFLQSLASLVEHSDRPGVQSTALEIIDALGVPEGPISSSLQMLLGQGKIPRRAARAIAGHPAARESREFFGLLQRQLAAPEKGHFIAAASTILEICRSDEVPPAFEEFAAPLFRRFNDRVPQVRRFASIALGCLCRRLRDQKILKRTFQRLDYCIDADTVFRAMVFSGEAISSVPWALDMLCGFLNSPDRRVQLTAAQAITRISMVCSIPSLQNAYLTMLSSTDSMMRGIAWQGALSLNDDHFGRFIVDHAIAMLSSNDQAVQRSAMIIIARRPESFIRENVVAALLSILATATEGTQKLAVEALGKCDRNVFTSADQMKLFVLLRSNDCNVVRGALNACSSIGPLPGQDRIVAQVVSLLGHTDPTVQLAAIDAARSLVDTDDSATQLAPIMDVIQTSANAGVRRHATECLRQLHRDGLYFFRAETGRTQALCAEELLHLEVVTN